MPIVVKDNGKRYVALPKDTSDRDTFSLGEWMLVDEQGNVVKDNISSESSLGDLNLANWNPSDENEFKKVYDINDLKVA